MTGPMPSKGVPVPSTSPLESTASLLARVRTGDAGARNRLAQRYLASLRRIAHGRVPPRVRGLLDTDDLVQVTLLRAFQHIETFEPRGEGAFLAYLRRILVNQIRDQVRRASRRPVGSELDDDVPSLDPSPLEEAIGRDQLELYEAALATLSETQREAVILRIELGFTYPQIAAALGQSSPNAARMLITRALVRMGHLMRKEVRHDS